MADQNDCCYGVSCCCCCRCCGGCSNFWWCFFVKLSDCIVQLVCQRLSATLYLTNGWITFGFSSNKRKKCPSVAACWRRNNFWKESQTFENLPDKFECFWGKLWRFVFFRLLSTEVTTSISSTNNNDDCTQFVMWWYLHFRFWFHHYLFAY